MKRLSLLVVTALLLTGCFNGGTRNNFVFDCVRNVQQPKELTLYCADAGQIIQDIRWFNWGDQSATGEGIVYTNLCDPNCADGTIARSKVKFTLLEPRDINGMSVFSMIQLLYVETPKGHPNVENVDLATEPLP